MDSLVDIYVTRYPSLLFVTVVAEEDDPDKSKLRFQIIVKEELDEILCSTVVVSSTYLILTLVILLSSIDQSP